MPGRMGCARAVGIERLASGAPQWAERFQIGPEAAGPGKVAPGMEAAASLEVPAAERFTAYLRASPPSPHRLGTIPPCFPSMGAWRGQGQCPQDATLKCIFLTTGLPHFPAQARESLLRLPPAFLASCTTPYPTKKNEEPSALALGREQEPNTGFLPDFPGEFYAISPLTAARFIGMVSPRFWKGFQTLRADRLRLSTTAIGILWQN